MVKLGVSPHVMQNVNYIIWKPSDQLTYSKFLSLDCIVLVGAFNKGGRTNPIWFATVERLIIGRSQLNYEDAKKATLESLIWWFKCEFM